MTARLHPVAHVVLGGSGYIGQALVQRLAVQDDPLLVVDTRAPVLPGLVPFDPESFGRWASRQYVRLDLSDPEPTMELFRRLRRGWPNELVVYHLAALFVKEVSQRAGVRPSDYQRHNVDTVSAVIRAVNAVAPRVRLIFQSTGGLEKWPENEPIPDPYVQSKRDAESLVCANCAADWVILRPLRVIGLTTPYGPHRSAFGAAPVLAGLRAARADCRIPPDVLTELLLQGRWRGDRLEIFLSAANNHVAYVHLQDAVSALVCAASSLTAPGQTFRVTTTPAITFADVGDILVEELQAVGVPAVVQAQYAADPYLLSPAFSPGFAWRPRLQRSRDVVRAAVWQYLDVARQPAPSIRAADRQNAIAAVGGQ